MTIPILKKIARNRKENVKDERKLVFVREKEKCKELSPRIFVIGIKRDNTIVIQRQFNTLVLFLPTWYVTIFIIMTNKKYF